LIFDLQDNKNEIEKQHLFVRGKKRRADRRCSTLLTSLTKDETKKKGGKGVREGWTRTSRAHLLFLSFFPAALVWSIENLTTRLKRYF
jgi:hypothetical protein